MIKKMDTKTYDEFWKEYSTNIKLGIMEDPTNRNRLSKLLRFDSSHSAETPTTLPEYMGRMKDKQESIFYVAGTSRSEVIQFLRITRNYDFLALKEFIAVSRK